MRNLKSIASAVAFMVLWAGAAIAMPTSFFSNDTEGSTVADLVADDDLDAIALKPASQGETDEVKVPDEDEDDEGEEGDEARLDNHGKAVSTAARCKLSHRAKGELVNSIARDESATVETAQAACEAAIAEAQAAGSTKPAKRDNAAKPEKAAKPEAAPKPQAPQPADTESSGGEGSSTETAPASPGPPADAGPPADKGPKKP